MSGVVDGWRSSSDGFFCDCRVAHRCSGCSVEHLGFTACAATYTGHHVKACALRPAVTAFHGSRSTQSSLRNVQLINHISVCSFDSSRPEIRARALQTLEAGSKHVESRHIRCGATMPGRSGVPE